MSQRKYPSTETRELIRYAEQLGFELRERRTGSGHLIMVHTSGRKVTLPSTPSGTRSRKNMEAQIRRTAQGL